MKKLNLLHRLLFFVNILMAISLLVAYSAPYIPPSYIYLPAFLGLALPYLLIINLIFLIYWLALGKSLFLLPMLVIIFGYKNIPAFVQLPFSSANQSEEASFKIMSFNVRVFDLYMWSEKKETRNEIFAFLKKENPDILCLQEFFYKDKQNPEYQFHTLDTLVNFLTAKNYHVYNTTTLRDNDHWGIITFSKFPIVGKGIVPFQDNGDNVCIYTDLIINRDTLRVYNTHLASIKLDKYDYKAIQGISENTYSENFGKEKMLLSKLKNGFQKRSIQADSIRSNIDQSPYPVMVCGDFNDNPASYAYQKVKGKLKDAFIESGSGFGGTYIGKLPSFRIDYIFYDQVFRSFNYTTHKVELSDHHPISTQLQFRMEEKKK